MSESGAPQTDPLILRSYRENWQRELEGAYLYRRLAASAERPDLARSLAEMADEEERHAALWQERVTAVHPGEASTRLARPPDRLIGALDGGRGRPPIVDER